MNKVQFQGATEHISQVEVNADRVIGIHIDGLDDQNDEHDMKMEVARGELDIEEYDDIQREIQGIQKPLFVETEDQPEIVDGRLVEGRLEVDSTFQFKKADAINPNHLQHKIRYLKDYEREKLDLPHKHYYMDHHMHDSLYNKVKSLNSNDRTIDLEFCTGYNTNTHNNVVWNTRFNCMLYTFENKIIVEEFENKRTQSILNLPEYISSLELSPDGLSLVVTAATVNPEIFAPVYIIDIASSSVKTRFLFHNRGVQIAKYSYDGEFILSLGNLKDGKLALWSPKEERLVASSHDISPMHDVDWRPTKAKGLSSKDREYEFTVAGRNKITQWRFVSKDDTLRIMNDKSFSLNGRERDVTAVKYVNNDARNCYNIVVGLESGIVSILDEKTLETYIDLALFELEISSILYNHDEDRIVITSLNGELKHWSFNSIRPENIDPDYDIRGVSLDSGITSLSLDYKFEEGVAGTIDGALKYVSLKDQKYAEFIQGIDENNPVKQTILLNQDILCTIHNLGNAKLWSAVTGEILKELKWKFSVSKISTPNLTLIRSHMLSWLQSMTESSIVSRITIS